MSSKLDFAKLLSMIFNLGNLRLNNSFQSTFIKTIKRNNISSIAHFHLREGVLENSHLTQGQCRLQTKRANLLEKHFFEIWDLKNMRRLE